MPFTPNPALMALNFVEGAALFFLLVFYAYLVWEFPRRFLKFWIAGWAALTSVTLSRVVLFGEMGTVPLLLTEEFSLLAGVLLLACILDYTGRSDRLSWLWASGFLTAGSLGVLGIFGGTSVEAGQTLVWMNCGLYILAGCLLWRHRGPQRGWAQSILAAALLLNGLHGMDRTNWPNLDLALLRIGSSAVLDVAMGIGMVVFVLETRRNRDKEFEQKLRGMALVIAAAAESLRVDRMLQEVLPPLAGSLNATHAVTHLFENTSEKPMLLLRASTGFSGRFLAAHFRLQATEPWICETLEKGAHYLAGPANTEGELGRWMGSEKLDGLALARLPGKAGPLGIMAIGRDTNRDFEVDDLDFLRQIAKLLGSAIQSVQQFEAASRGFRRWTSVFDSVGDLILVHGSDHRVIYVSRDLAKRKGKEPDELKGELVCDVFRQEKKGWVNCPYCEASGEEAETVDLTLSDCFQVTHSGSYGPSGERRGAIHVLREIAGKPQAERSCEARFEGTGRVNENSTCLPEQPLQSETCKPGQDSAAGKILVVDGEAAALEMEQEILRGCGLSVLPVQTARAAVEILEREPIDGIVLDVHLPGEISGWGLYRWIESHRPELADNIVFTFSNGGEEEARLLVGICGGAALQKPVDVNEFWEAARRVLIREVPVSVKS